MKAVRVILILLLPPLVGFTLLLQVFLGFVPALAFAFSLVLSTLFVLFLTELVTVESYQRLLISRGGHLLDTGIQGQRAFLLRPIDRPIPVDLRVRTRSFSNIACFTQEGAQVNVDYMFLWRVVRPTDFVLGPSDIPATLEGIVNATLRNELSKMRLLEVFQHRQVLAESLLRTLRSRHEIAGWGVQIIDLQLEEMKIPATVREALTRQITADLARAALVFEGQGLAQGFEQMQQVAGEQAWLVQAIKTLGDVFSNNHTK